MKNKIIITFALFLISITLGNLLVHWLGRWGVLITSFVFIPFDFIIRCYIHELYRGKKLYYLLFGIITLGAIATYIVNHDAKNIALGSVTGFAIASLAGSLFYQFSIKQIPLIKVNGSDIIALIVDSIIFQMIAFNSIVWAVTSWQIAVKILGGLLWYYILIYKLNFINKLKSSNHETN